ncbi:MAG: ATP-binding cassette domain-containing protein [Bacteroidetes bacterium]|uniref:ATP-binding cassette domain-containing protein n=1 Tax=Candidatus Enterocola intestinipullorum TaxID=2840783 RepID=A0A9D9EGE9_9BACT|nr:ATP-binding cassette domain-containing protein [Candidatus Enterocola intestinipullorum]
MSLVVSNISKAYGPQQVLSGLSFNLDDGNITGLLGPNGAGKSTTMKIISGILPPDSGSVLIDGTDMLAGKTATKRLVGYLPENNPLYHDMYVKEFLIFIAGLYGIKGKTARARVEELIHATGLENECSKKIGTLSKGYKQRVGLAHAVLHKPRLLVLDEPTTGLDPNQIIQIRQLIKDFGCHSSVLFSTHIMQEAAAVCDRILIMKKGEIVADMPTEGKSAEELETLFRRLTA